MDEHAGTKLIPHAIGRDLQKVLASQLSFADLEEAVAFLPPGADRSYHSNETLWRDVLAERLRAQHTIRLDGFSLSEWVPLSPGLFHTPEAAWSRGDAQEEVISGPGIDTARLDA